jgi:hypothetical protein
VAIREAIMDEKKPNAESGTPDRMNGRSGGGDSGGGAYPNPHTGKDGKRGGFMDHGGQTEMPYHGSGQLGEEKVGGGNANAPASKTKPGETQD